jgi:predicted oxidoreductase (fatty acid repression mutant protein)
MNRRYSLSAVGILALSVASLFAQDKAGTLVTLEFQRVKHQIVPQYEAGRKQKAAWHKQQNDPLSLLVWEVLSGDDTGTYAVGRFGQHWADLDKPAISDEADIAEFEKVMGANVDSIVTR